MQAGLTFRRRCSSRRRVHSARRPRLFRQTQLLGGERLRKCVHLSDDPLTSMRAIVSYTGKRRARRGHTRIPMRNERAALHVDATRSMSDAWYIESPYSICCARPHSGRDDRVKSAEKKLMSLPTVRGVVIATKETRRHMTRKSGFLGFGEGDDFAEGRAGAGGRKEGLREEAREKARGAVGGRRVRGEQASGSVREDDGAGRAEVGGPWGTKKELRGDQHLRSRQDIQPDHASQSTFGQANNIPRDYFLYIIQGFYERVLESRLSVSPTGNHVHHSLLQRPNLSFFHTPVVHTANGPRIRFAITTRSPTITNSSFLIGTRSVEKYVRIDLMHEYAGLGELCRSTGTARWYETDSA